MKVYIEILRYIMCVILTLSIGIMFACNLIDLTVLSRNYIINKFEENQYYSNIYKDVQDSFSKYIMQSGLDENVIKDIVNENKVKDDTNIIISNIYDGNNKEIEIESIKQKLNENIQTSLNDKKLTEESKSSIEQFINLISNDYILTIMHTNYETKIHQYIMKFDNSIDKIFNLGKYATIISIVFILIINIKSFNRNISMLGISLSLLGCIFIYVQYLIYKNINIYNIYILNQSFSNVIKNIAIQNLDSLIIYGKQIIVLGFIFILIGNIIRSIFQKNEKKPILLLQEKF